MKRTKRVLSLMICLLLAVTSLPVTQLVTFADATTENIVSFHETTVSSVDDVNWVIDNGKEAALNAATYITPSVDSDGYYTFTMKDTVGTGTNKMIDMPRDFSAVIERDDVNRTTVVTDNLDGKYRIDFDLGALVKTYTGTSTPYFNLILCSGNKKILYIRMRNSYVELTDTDSSTTREYKRDNRNFESSYPDEFKVSVEIDTVNNTVKSYFNDELMTKHNDTEQTINALKTCGTIDGITTQILSRTDIGSYLKFKEIKITQISRTENTGVNTVLDSLPEKLVSNVNAATETSVTLPEVDGVTWASADETAATVSGNTLTLLPSTTGTKEAAVTATFTTDGREYVKTYKMTLAQDNESVTPVPPVTGDGVVSFNKIFNYDDLPAAIADGWSSGGENHVEFIVKNGYPYLNQTQQTITTNNTGATASFGSAATFKFPAGPVATDVDNRTSVINEDGKYQGIVKIDVAGTFELGSTTAYQYEHKYTEGNEEKTSTFTVNVSYASMDFTGDPTGDKPLKAVQWRIRASKAQAMSNTSESPSDIKTPEGSNDLGGNPKEGILMSTTIDMDAETVTATIPETGNGQTSSGSTWASFSSKANLTYIDKLSIEQMIRVPVGSFSQIESVSLTTLDPKFGTETTAMLDKLPEKLDVNDINAVTTAEFTLPEVAGVEWTSSDNALISIDGTKATVNRVRGEAKEVAVKATFTADGIKYSKEYAMTLAAGDNIIKYYDINGDIFTTLEVKDGEKATEIAAPSVEHYNFLGWYEEGATTAFDFDTAISNHVTLYAKYEAKTYNVIFKADGNTVATLTGKYNDVVNGEIPAIPAKNGYTTVGWYVGNTDEIFGASTIITGPDMIINAKYAEGSLSNHTVTFKVDGSVYATESAVDGYAVTIPENPTKANYTFAHWTYNGVEFDVNTPITSDITLEAKFNPNPVNVNFYMDEAMTELYTTGTGYYNTAYGNLPVPAKDLYKFLGWKNADGTDFTAEQVITEEISVYATWEYAVKVILDEDITQYTSTTGNSVEFIDIQNGFTEASLDGGYVTRVVNSSPTSRSNTEVLIGKIKLPIGEYDEVNRTQVYNSKLTGDYEIELIFDAKLSGAYTAADGTSVNSPYGYVSTGTYEKEFGAILANRMYKDNIQSFNSTSGSSNSFNNLDTNKVGSRTSFEYPTVQNGVAKDVSLKIRYNPFENMAYMTMNDRPDYAWGTPLSKEAYINAFYFTMMPCNQNGDYINIKRVRVIQYNDYSDTSEYKKVQDTLALLPDSIASDPHNAAGFVELPEIKGVTWSSSNESIVSSKTGEVIPWYDDEEVIVTATVSAGNFSFTKEYALTVKRDPNVDVKEIINKSFSSEDDISDWSFVNLEDIIVGDYSVDENGVTISKIAAAKDSEINYETKRYFAFFDLYTETASDEYSTTETKDLKGVYDVTVDMSKYSSSILPTNLAIGYRNGNDFYGIGSLKINSEGTKFVYSITSEATESIDITVPDSAKVTFRVDTNRNEICLYVDGVLVTDRIVFLSRMGEDVRINSLKVELDTNSNAGDYVTVKNVTVNQVIYNKFAELDDIVDASKGIDIYDITSNPASVSGYINELPETVNGYKVVWESSSDQIDMESREVFHDSTAKTVYITAEIYDAGSQYPLYVRKTFVLNVRAALNDAELDEFKINSLGKITNQDYDDIRYDLNLPQVDGIVWTSSNTSVIDNNGKIKADAIITENTPVVITATSNGTSKDYNLTVSPRTPQVSLANGAAPLTITLGSVNNAKLSADVITSFSYTKGETGKVNVCDDEGNILVSMIAEEDGIYFDYLGSDYKKYNVATANIDIIVMPDVDKAAIFVDGAIVADYVSLKNNTDYAAKVESEINVGNITMTTDKYGILQGNIDNFDYFSEVKYGYADLEGLNLSANALTNALVTWTSSDTSILANNGNVTTPNAMKLVDLKFRITDAENANVYIEKVFEIAVDCDNSRNMVFGIAPTVKIKDPDYPQKNISDGLSDTLFKVIDSGVSDSEIIFDLGERKVFNAIYVLQADVGMEGYKIYTSNDGSAWSEVASGNMEGELSKFIRFSDTTASYIKFVVEKCSADEVSISELKVFLSGTDLELAQYDFDLLSINTTPTGTTIDLPKTGVNGTEFTWESSDENVISTDGKITRPKSATTVTLTVKATVDGQTLTKTFNVYVDTKSTSGPTQVGGSGGGGGGGGIASGGAGTTPIIGEATDDTVYAEDIKSNETTINPNADIYHDVKTSDWYYNAVMTLTNKGIVSGDGTGYFNPNDNVTREQFVKMILEALEIETSVNENPFTDVAEGMWYTDYITTAHSMNIVNGLAATHFGVGANITRQDMAVLIERVLKVKEIEIAKSEVEPFADAAEVSSYAAEAVSNMKSIGLIQGYNNMYNPKDNLTRAEAATVIASLLELLTK